MLKRVFFLIAVIFSTNAFATPERSSRPDGAIGANLGWIEANGLSFRKYLGDQYFQFSFAGTYDRAKGQEYADASFSYAKYLNIYDLSRNVMPIGFKFVTGIEVERDADRSNDIVNSNNLDPANELHVGAGFGIDVGNPLKRGLSVSFNAVYTASFADFKEMEFVRLGLLPSIGVHYAY